MFTPNEPHPALHVAPSAPLAFSPDSPPPGAATEYQPRARVLAWHVDQPFVLDGPSGPTVWPNGGYVMQLPGSSALMPVPDGAWEQVYEPTGGRS